MRRRQYTNTPTTNRQQLEGTTTNPFDSWSAGVHRPSIRAVLGRSLEGVQLNAPTQSTVVACRIIPGMVLSILGRLSGGRSAVIDIFGGVLCTLHVLSL